MLTQSIDRQDVMQKHFARTDEVSAPTDWQAAYTELEQSLRWDTSNPAIVEQMGTLWVMRGNVGNTIHTSYTEAVRYFERAAVLRPTSPYIWANLAWVKYQLGEVDNVFYSALANAINMGPWEREVQMIATDLGLALWDEMPQTLRPMLLQIVQNGQQRYATEIGQIAARRGKLGLVCRFDNMAKSKQCEQESQ
ncbi:MAG: hypothetical protein JNM52_05505 [Betaproteobacteria bacterium]|nr:hypothetical protein [Betaproteobacteria bacterium]